jgi:hypothetical protein
MARINFPVPGQCSEQCCHRLETSAATSRICLLGSSARICLASSRACLRQGMFEPLCCAPPLQLAQKASANEVSTPLQRHFQGCSINDMHLCIMPKALCTTSPGKDCLSGFFLPLHCVLPLCTSLIFIGGLFHQMWLRGSNPLAIRYRPAARSKHPDFQRAWENGLVFR